ncbi:MAG: hypothetical protein LBQ79_13330 [Deltaproteobacteria bacterium]|jgi:hypothetical protein|nr:hypothetical protein [Deltaproteobacteria bacterium]
MRLFTTCHAALLMPLAALLLALAPACRPSEPDGDGRGGGSTDEAVHPILWSRDFGPEPGGGFVSASPLLEGAVVLAGFAVPSAGNGSGTDAWLVRVDHDGSVRWQAFLGGSGEDRAMSVAPAGGGGEGWLAAGWTLSPDGDFPASGGGTPGAWAAGLDGSGKLLWSRVLPGRGSGGGRALAVGGEPDGSVTVVGFAGDPAVPAGPGCSGPGPVLWKLSSDGNGARAICPALDTGDSPHGWAAVAPGGGAVFVYGDRGEIRVADVGPEGEILWDSSAGPGTASAGAVGVAKGGSVAVGGSDPEGNPLMAGLDTAGRLLWRTSVRGFGPGSVSSVARGRGWWFGIGRTEGDRPGVLCVLTDNYGLILWSAVLSGTEGAGGQAAAALVEGIIVASGGMPRDGIFPGSAPADPFSGAAGPRVVKLSS